MDALTEYRLMVRHSELLPEQKAEILKDIHEAIKAIYEDERLDNELT